MSGRASGDEEPVSVDKLFEGVADGVAGPPDTDGLHHPRVPELAATQLAVEHHRLLVLVGLDAAHEERVAQAGKTTDNLPIFQN